MPSYEFECLKCGHTFIEIWTVGEYERVLRRGPRCPKCNTRRLEQKLSAQVQTGKKS